MSYFDLTGSLLTYDERQKIRDDPVLNELYCQLEATRQELDDRRRSRPQRALLSARGYSPRA
jgi:hypothetical protein